jgi:predicted helicase
MDYDAGEVQPKRKPNLNPEIIATISKKLKLPFVADHEEPSQKDKSQFSPLDVLDYIYAVLHSPSYRETYKEFLKIDFPRIPYPTNAETFWQLVALGGEVRRLHLLEHPALAKLTTTFPVGGDCTVEAISKNSFREIKDGKGRVYINTEQYIGGVPTIAWEFFIGGYQPAQKWLKDRKGKQLSFEDIRNEKHAVH